MQSPPTPVAEHQLTAFNYATDSDNRIHADDVAQQFGFRGGLVPGVGDYAYLARIAQQALDPTWLRRGWMEAKFIKPVYDGAQVTARALTTETPGQVTLELLDDDGQLCAIGRAGNSASDCSHAWFDPNELVEAALPTPPNRIPARRCNLSTGLVFGTLHLDQAATEQWHVESTQQFIDQLTEPTDLLHPAFAPDMGNEILMRNTKLGPWIHTASRVRHLGPLTKDDAVSVRGRVAQCTTKKGREVVELEVGVYTGTTCRTQLHHTAIIHLPT